MSRSLAFFVLLAACEDAPVLPEGVGARTLETSETAMERGYPEGFPRVPGGRFLEGAVDPGVVRTSAYEHTSTCEAFEAALRERFSAAGARVVHKSTLGDGAVSLRVAHEGREASFSMHEELGRCVLRTVSSDDAASRQP